MTKKLLQFSLPLLVAGTLAAQALEPVTLPKPKTEGGKPLLTALAERKSSREFSPEKLSPQMLSNLLWAAAGVNRPDGHRTAPSANNRQETDVYAVTAEGAYLYNPKEHRLDPVAAGDLRALTGTQPFVATAPLNLVYVGDPDRGGSGDNTLYSAGFIGQNVYLFCASEGLGTVIRGLVDRAALAKALKLRPGQRITLAQTVGYPAKK